MVKPKSPLLITALPPELLLHVFNYLNPVTLLKISSVCRTWFQLTRDAHLWKVLPYSPFFFTLYSSLNFFFVFTKISGCVKKRGGQRTSYLIPETMVDCGGRCFSMNGLGKSRRYWVREIPFLFAKPPRGPPLSMCSTTASSPSQFTACEEGGEEGVGGTLGEGKRGGVCRNSSH